MIQQQCKCVYQDDRVHVCDECRKTLTAEALAALDQQVILQAKKL